MNYKILLDKKDGNVFDITTIVSKATLTFKRTGSASVFSITCLKGDAFHQNNLFEFENGDVIQLYVDDIGRFYGFIFSIENRLVDQSFVITCYDQLKYLIQNKITKQYLNKKASEIITSLAKEFDIEIGTIADTKFVIPKFLQDNKTILDTYYESLHITSDNGGGQYCLYDDFLKIMLTPLKDMKTNYVISDTTHIQDVVFKKDIENSYNIFKLVKDNSQTGHRDWYQYQNSDKINKWGMLQYFNVVNEGLNEAQIQAQLNALYGLKGKENKSLSIKSVGEFVRAGESVAIIVDELNIKQFYVINEVKHTFENGNNHTMDLKLYVAA